MTTNEILADIRAWARAGKPVALATVIRTWGSAPRPAGSKMAVSGQGEMSGSVSAGCVESAVVQEALEVLRNHRPRRLRYGVADETAWEVGLTCGGEIDIFVESWTGLEGLVSWLQGMALDSLPPMVRLIVVGGPEEALGQSVLVGVDGRIVAGDPNAFPETLMAHARSVLAGGTADTRQIHAEGRELEVLVDPWLPPPTLVIVGGVHIAVALSRLAGAIGYRHIIIEPRAAFAAPGRFPEAEMVERTWTDEALQRIGLTPATAVAVLSHDPKLDDPALLAALRSPAFYIGALGSDATNLARRRRLLAAGLSEDELARLHAPIGIDLGRQDAEGIALSILAEIVATWSGRSRIRLDPSGSE